MTSARLRNLGPVSMSWLESAGIASLEDLQSLGALEAYRQIKAIQPKASLVLLYALEGALLDCPWNDLPPGVKERLRKTAKGSGL